MGPLSRSYTSTVGRLRTVWDELGSAMLGECWVRLNELTPT
jgi:hypothetical protein